MAEGRLERTEAFATGYRTAKLKGACIALIEMTCGDGELDHVGFTSSILNADSRSRAKRHSEKSYERAACSVFSNAAFVKGFSRSVIPSSIPSDCAINSPVYPDM